LAVVLPEVLLDVLRAVVFRAALERALVFGFVFDFVLGFGFAAEGLRRALVFDELRLEARLDELRRALDGLRRLVFPLGMLLPPYVRT